MVNKENKLNMTLKEIFFWQSRDKSDKKHNLRSDLYSFFFLSLNIVPLISSDCPSQSRDVILVTMGTSSASAGQCAENVTATFAEAVIATQG